MKKRLRSVLALLAVLWTFFPLHASGLPGYAPKNTGIIVFADLKRLSDSRLVRKIFSENPELREIRDGIDQEIREQFNAEPEELFDSEVCAFIDVIAPDDIGCQIFFVNHSGCAKKIFDFAAAAGRNSGNPAFSVGKTGDVPFVRNEKWILLQTDPRTLQFSFSGNDPARFVPLTKTASLLAGEIDTGALLGIAVDLAKVPVPDDLQQDENFKEMLCGLVKVTFHFTEKDDTLVFRTVAVYRDEKSAAKAKAAADRLNEAVQKTLSGSAGENDRLPSQLQKLTVSDTTTLDGARLTGTSVIDRDLAIGFIRALFVKKAE